MNTDSQLSEIRQIAITVSGLMEEDRD